MEAPKKMETVLTGTASGMRYAVCVNPFGGCNGYVQLPTGYPTAWDSYDDIHVEVHYGLTYGPDEDGWVGFDTLHSGDAWVGTVRVPQKRKDEGLGDAGLDILRGDHYADEYRTEWTEALVEAECRSLAEQLNGLMVS